MAGAFTTSGSQIYGNGGVILDSDVTLTSSGNAALDLNSTVNGGFGLTLNTGGVTTLGAAVGNATPLASLTTNAGGTTAINGGSVRTTGSQT